MATDCKDTECYGSTGPNAPVTLPSPGQNPCFTYIEGLPNCGLNVGSGCTPFSLEDENICYILELVDEALKIGGATMNIHKLLGVHEQGKLVDCTGLGNAISGGDTPGFPAANAFDAYVTKWRSIQKGEDNIKASSFIGYDFGEIKTSDDSRNMYGTTTEIFKHITAINIKQSDNPDERVTRARIERSDDGKKWLGVAIVGLPDDNCLNTIYYKDSVPSRFWRIRPLDFTGGASGNVWSVQAIEMFHNYTATDEDNIQDKVFLENRDRDYDKDTVAIKGYYDLIDVTTELSRHGIELPSQSFYIQVSFLTCVAILGRPIIIGDILEMPSEAQFSDTLRRLRKYVEVIDVAWSTEGYTPGWTPTMLRIVAQPAYHSQETQDIFGDLDAKPVVPDGLGLFDNEDGNSLVSQDYFDASQTAQAEARDNVPQRGAEGSGHIREFEDATLAQAAQDGVRNLNSIGLNPVGLYVEDAIPSNNEPYTEADAFPDSPTHGDYHRLIYVGLASDVPARLYRYSESKGWVFLETDKRSRDDGVMPKLQEFLNCPTGVPVDEVTQSDRDKIEKDCE